MLATAHLTVVPTCAPGETWQKVHANMLDFLKRYGVRAQDLGWTDLDLFGVHPGVGTTRTDYCSALVLSEKPPTTWSIWSRPTSQRRATRPLPLGREHRISVAAAIEAALADPAALDGWRKTMIRAAILIARPEKVRGSDKKYQT